jgi:hypothetical protein
VSLRPSRPGIWEHQADVTRRVRILEAVGGGPNTSNLFEVPDAPLHVEDGFAVVTFLTQLVAPYTVTTASPTVIPDADWPWISVPNGDVAYNAGWRVELTASVKRGTPMAGGQRLTMEVTSDFGSYPLVFADQEPTNPNNVFYSGAGPIVIDTGTPYAANDVLKVQAALGALNPPVLIQDGFVLIRWVPAGAIKSRHVIPEQYTDAFEPTDLSVSDGGFTYYNLTINKLKLWTGLGWEIIDSAP